MPGAKHGTAAACALALVALSAASSPREATASPPDGELQRDAAEGTRGDGISGVAAPSVALGTAALHVRSVRLRPLDREALRAEDALRSASRWSARARVGVRRHVRLLAAPRHLRPGARGVNVLPDGSLLWVGEVSAEESSGLRLHFRRFDLPPGAAVTLHDADEPEESYGPFASRGPGREGAFHAPTVFGSRVRVELRVPAEGAGHEVRLAVDSLLDFHVRPPPFAATPHGHRALRSMCTHVDAACDPAILPGPGRAVSLIVFASGGSCSGSLVDDTDGSTQTPWFLTANHCVATHAEAQTTEFFFDYAAPTCGGNAPSLQSVPRSLGATLVATSTTTDVSLLLLTGSVPSGRTQLPVHSLTPAVGAQVVAVHHPAGETMKVSKGSIVENAGTRTIVDWTLGHIEPGTSGSPLLDASGRVIGIASQGDLPWCDAGSRCYYGRIDQSWSILQAHLAPVTTPGPPPPPAPPPVGAPPEFFWSLWNFAVLGDGETKTWNARLFPAPGDHPAPRLRIRVRSRHRPTVRLTDPDRGVHVFVRRGRVFSPPPGRWVIELSVPENAPKRLVKIRVAKNFF